MILFAHMLFGAAIGALVQNMYVAVILAFLSHYVLDALPHIEYLKDTETKIKEFKEGWQEHVHSLVKVAIDFFLAILAISLISNNPPIVYLCALAAIVPDGLTIIHALFPTGLLDAHQKFHRGKVHYLTKQKNFSVFWKVATQVVVVAVSLVILIR